MAVLLPFPSHPIVSRSLRLSRRWAHDHQVHGGLPVSDHAERVAEILGDCVPAITPELVAAALLHRAAEYAPAGDVDQVIADQISREVARIVRSLVDQRRTYGDRAPAAVDDPPVLLITTAGHVVSTAPGAEPGTSTRDLPDLLSHLQVFHQDALLDLPVRLTRALARQIARVEAAAQHGQAAAGRGTGVCREGLAVTPYQQSRQ